MNCAQSGIQFSKETDYLEMLRRRFTRKLTRNQKHNPKNNLEVNIHKLLNRLDIEKDAFYSKSPMTKKMDRFTPFNI